MRLVVLLFGFISFTGLVLPLFRKSYWWLRVFDYPKLHLVVLALVVVIMNYQIWRFNNSTATLFSLLILLISLLHVPAILKYTPLSRVNAKKTNNKSDSHCFRIIQCNIRMENKEVGKVIALVKKYQPDILLLVEPDNWWAENLKDLDNIYVFRVKQPQENTYGMILYSKFPLEKTEINFLVKQDIPSIFTEIKLPASNRFLLYCLHPEPPRPGTDTYERDAELLITGKRIKESQAPSMVVGDLNDVAWSYTSELFQRYSELLDPREGRGFYNTYNARIPVFRYPLDHFFYSKHFGLVKLQKLEDVGSDHFPMMMDLCLEPSQDHAQGQEQATEDDKETVRQKINEA